MIDSQMNCRGKLDTCEESMKKSHRITDGIFYYCLNLSMILSRKELFPLYWEQSSPISLAK